MSVNRKRRQPEVAESIVIDPATSCDEGDRILIHPSETLGLSRQEARAVETAAEQIEAAEELIKKKVAFVDRLLSEAAWRHEVSLAEVESAFVKHQAVGWQPSGSSSATSQHAGWAAPPSVAPSVAPALSAATPKASAAAPDCSPGQPGCHGCAHKTDQVHHGRKSVLVGKWLPDEDSFRLSAWCAEVCSKICSEIRSEICSEVMFCFSA